MLTRIKELGPGLLLLMACLIPFLAGIHGPFLLDDQSNLLRARAQSGELIDWVDALLRNNSGALRRPVSNLSFLVNYHWIGQTPFHYKAVNLFIHLCNGLLVWALARRILLLLQPSLPKVTAGRLGLAAAAIWIAHPLQVSTVLYAVQRMTQLSAFFVFAATLVSLTSLARLSSRSGFRSLVAHLGAVFALFALAVLSKENGALFPLLLAATLICAPHETQRVWWKNPTSRAFAIITVAIPLAIGAIAATIALPWIASAYEVREFTLVERLLTQPTVIAHYLSTILVPDIRQMGLFLDDFDIRRSNDIAAWLMLLATCAVPVIAFVVRSRAPVLAFGVLWFFAAHAMESTIIALEIAFEHRNYLALLGPVLVVVYYAWKAATHFKLEPRQIGLAAALPLLLLMALTGRRAHQWSGIDLFTAAEVAHHPRSTRALTQAAAQDVANKRFESALKRLRTAQALRPDNFWLRAYDLHFACVGLLPKANWEQLIELARRNPNQLGIDEALRPIGDRYTDGSCKHLDIAEFDAFLTQLMKVVDSTSRPTLMERLLIIRHTLATERGDRMAAESFLRQGAAANPSGTDSLNILAYKKLNAGDLDEADALADEMERRIALFHRKTKQFEVSELRNFIRQERKQRP